MPEGREAQQINQLTVSILFKSLAESHGSVAGGISGRVFVSDLQVHGARPLITAHVEINALLKGCGDM